MDDYRPRPTLFNVLQHNVCSLLPKVNHLVSLPHLQDYHVISINETWLKPDLPDSHLSLPNFDIHRTDRQSAFKTRGGGAALYIKQSLVATRLDVASRLPSCDSVWIRIRIDGRPDLVVATAYLPPDHDKGQFTSELNQLVDDPLFNNVDLLLVGDLNINWNADTRHRRDLAQFLHNSEMCQIISHATHVSSSTGSESLIDLCLLSRTLPVATSTALLTDISDHYAITASLDILTRKTKPRVIRLVRNFSCLPILTLIPRDDTLLQEMRASECPSEQANMLERWVSDIVDKYAPVRRCRLRPDSPRWLTGELKRLVAAKNRFYRKAYAIGTASAIFQYKKFRNSVQRELRRARCDFYAEKLSDDSRSFYTQANTFLGRNRQASNGGPSEIRAPNGGILTAGGDIANELNRFFTSIPSPHPTEPLVRQNAEVPTLKFRLVQRDQIQKLLRGLNPSKRGGINQTPTSVYKCLEATVVPALTILINQSIRSSVFPEAYKSALVSCIHKSGDRHDPGNYRPISSLPILSKVMERVLNKQIYDHVNEHSLLSDKQFGFRAGLNTEQMLLSVIDRYLSVLDTKSPVYIAQLSLDVRKAFDTVDHAHLCKKLTYEYRFHDSSCALITSYLANRMQQTKIDTDVSSPRLITKGVPQGSILGPLLFNLMVNDMLSMHVTANSYADDTLIYSISTTQPDAISGAVSDFNRINDWYVSNGLSLCAHKTNCLVISNRKVDYAQQVPIAGSVIPIRSNVKVLGVLIDSKLEFKDHIKAVTNKVSSQLYALRRARKYLDSDQTKLIYTSIIRPKLEYCSSLFFKTTLANSNLLESSQNRAIRVICKAPNIFSVTDGRRCLDLHTLASRRSVAFFRVAMQAAYGLSSNILFNFLRNCGNSNTNLRSNCIYILPHTCTIFGLRRFTYQAIKAFKTPEASRPTLDFIAK